MWRHGMTSLAAKGKGASPAPHFFLAGGVSPAEGVLSRWLSAIEPRCSCSWSRVQSSRMLLSQRTLTTPTRCPAEAPLSLLDPWCSWPRNHLLSPRLPLAPCPATQLLISLGWPCFVRFFSAASTNCSWTRPPASTSSAWTSLAREQFSTSFSRLPCRLLKEL